MFVVDDIGLVLGLIGFGTQIAHLINKLRHKKEKRQLQQAVTRINQSDGRTRYSTSIIETKQRYSDSLGRMQQSYESSLRTLTENNQIAHNAFVDYNKTVLETFVQVFTIQQESHDNAMMALLEQTRYFTLIIVYLAGIVATLMYILGRYQARSAGLSEIPARVIQMDGNFPLPVEAGSGNSVLELVFHFANSVFEGFCYIPAVILQPVVSFLGAIWGMCASASAWLFHLIRAGASSIVSLVMAFVSPFGSAIDWLFHIIEALLSPDKVFSRSQSKPKPHQITAQLKRQVVETSLSQVAATSATASFRASLSKTNPAKLSPTPTPQIKPSSFPRVTQNNATAAYLAAGLHHCIITGTTVIIYPANFTYDFLITFLTLCHLPETISILLLCAIGIGIVGEFVFHRMLVVAEIRRTRGKCNHAKDRGAELVLISIHLLGATILGRSLLDLGVSTALVYTIEGLVLGALVVESRVFCGQAILLCLG
jgi:hypothetical protein